MWLMEREYLRCVNDGKRVGNSMWAVERDSSDAVRVMESSAPDVVI
jgi:hypothetical protein